MDYTASIDGWGKKVVGGEGGIKGSGGIQIGGKKAGKWRGGLSGNGSDGIWSVWKRFWFGTNVMWEEREKWEDQCLVWVEVKVFFPFRKSSCMW